MKPTIGVPAPGTAQRDRIPSDPVAGTAAGGAVRHAPRKPTLSMIGFLAVAMVIGYEWFMSGLVKFVRGDFPDGLADELVEKSAGAPAWSAAS